MTKKDNKRMTSSDYKKELKDLETKKNALIARLRTRVADMITQNPDVSMGTIDYANAKPKEVFVTDYLKNIDKHGTTTLFDLMETIESDIASRQLYKQAKIDFGEN
jgi:hypothetical protein